MAERSSEEIRRDLETTRAEMDDTVDALQRKLSPGQLVDDLWGRLKRNGGVGSNVGDLIRDHPVPIALMALGLGWLAIERATASRSPREPWHDADTEADRELETREPGRLSRLKDKAAGAVERVKESASHAAETVRSKAGELTHRARDATSQGGEAASSRMREMRERMAEGTRRRREQVERGMSNMIEDHPLALGAMAFGAGLAVGVSVPSSRFEDQLMGDTSDALKSEVRDVTRRTKAVVQETAGAVADEVRRPEGGVGERVERGIEQGRRTAERAAREQGVTPDALKQRAERQQGDRGSERAPPPPLY
jgi:hypothetical protein